MKEIPVNNWQQLVAVNNAFDKQNKTQTWFGWLTLKDIFGHFRFVNIPERDCAIFNHQALTEIFERVFSNGELTDIVDTQFANNQRRKQHTQSLRVLYNLKCDLLQQKPFVFPMGINLFYSIPMLRGLGKIAEIHPGNSRLMFAMYYTKPIPVIIHEHAGTNLAPLGLLPIDECPAYDVDMQGWYMVQSHSDNDDDIKTKTTMAIGYSTNWKELRYRCPDPTSDWNSLGYSPNEFQMSYADNTMCVNKMPVARKIDNAWTLFTDDLPQLIDNGSIPSQ